MLIKRFTGACKADDRRLSLGCVGAFQSADWALVKWLTGTDEVVDAVLGLLLTVSLSPVLFFHQEPQMTFSQSAGSGVPRQGCEVEDACSPDQFDYYSGVDQGGEQ